MKLTIRLIVQYLFYGIAVGCISFVLMCTGLYAAGGTEELMHIVADFGRQALGAVAVGIACGTTAIVYRVSRLPFAVKLLIHFSVGMGVFYPVAIALKWFPISPKYAGLQFLGACGIFMGIWGCFYLYNHSEARKINAQLRASQRTDTGPADKS